ncbi:hypothetical protein ACTPC6_13600 [Clostridioides difficile]
MNENPSFEQIEIVNIVNNFIIALITSIVAFILLVVFNLVLTFYNVRLAPIFISIFIPLYLSYFVVPNDCKFNSSGVSRVKQDIEATNYNIGNG